jgi:SOS-response transcriptional repressor LexA
MSETNGAGLTPRQRDVLAFIARYQAAHDCAPSLQEIADALGMKAKSQAHKLIRGLQERGAVRALPGRQRSIRIIGEAPTHPASTDLVEAVRVLLDNIRREDPEAGFAVVDADALGDLDIAYKDYLDSAEASKPAAAKERPQPHG